MSSHGSIHSQLMLMLACSLSTILCRACIPSLPFLRRISFPILPPHRFASRSLSPNPISRPFGSRSAVRQPYASLYDQCVLHWATLRRHFMYDRPPRILRVAGSSRAFVDTTDCKTREVDCEKPRRDMGY